MIDHQAHAFGLAVACIQAFFPPCPGNRRTLVFMPQIVSDLFQQFIIRAEESRFTPFLEQTQVVVRPFRKHERPAGRNFHGPVGLGIPVQLAQKTKINPGCT